MTSLMWHKGVNFEKQRSYYEFLVDLFFILCQYNK